MDTPSVECSKGDCGLVAAAVEDGAREALAMIYEITPAWERVMAKLFGRRLVDENGHYVCRTWRGKIYLKVPRG